MNALHNCMILSLFIAPVCLGETADNSVKSSCTIRSPGCLNGGTCVQLENHAACICNTQYTGEFCHLKNPCHNSPCVRGTCEIYEDGAICSCIPGYEGTYCDKKAALDSKNEMLGIPQVKAVPEIRKTITQLAQEKPSVECLNGGILKNQNSSDHNESQECECPDNFTGKLCEIPNPCFHNPCKNGGSCEVYEDIGMCSCPTGFGGQFCEEIVFDGIRNTLELGSKILQNKTEDNVKPDHPLPVPVPAIKEIEKGTPHNNSELETIRKPEQATRNISLAVIDPSCAIYSNGSSNKIPCSNRGKCIAANSTSSLFSCQCPIEYTGDQCQFKDPCHQFSCKNGGTCQAFEDSGICYCPTGFVGTFCEQLEIKQHKLEETTTRAPAIPSQKRKNGDMGNATSCSSLNIATSHSTPTPVCLNGGKCTRRINKDSIAFYECECPSQFVGEHCEFNNACYKSPCKNGGTCQIFVDGGICSCLIGFKGTFCEDIEIDHSEKGKSAYHVEGLIQKNADSGATMRKVRNSKIDYCENSQDIDIPICLNGGQCIVLNEGEEEYGCLCPFGYKGRSCEIHDTCMSGPCKNGGTCEAFEDGAICICMENYTGQFCENKIFTGRKYTPSPKGRNASDGRQHSKAGVVLAKYQENNVEILKHLYRSKIPVNPSPLEADGVVPLLSKGSNEIDGVTAAPLKTSGLGDVFPNLVRVGPDGTLYVKKPKPQKTKSKPLAFHRNHDVPPAPNDEPLVDARIAKVMPNGELFIKMKIPTHSPRTTVERKDKNMTRVGLKKVRAGNP